jgi:hypothetical protein
MEFEYKTLNKSLMLTRRNSMCSWSVEPNIFEAIKAEAIWNAKDSSANYLPRFPIHVDEDHYPDLYQWRMIFNSGTEFRGHDALLAELLRDVDFSKPFNKELSDSICSKFKPAPKKVSSVDADLIIQGELGELEEKP